MTKEEFEDLERLAEQACIEDNHIYGFLEHDAYIEGFIRGYNATKVEVTHIESFDSGDISKLTTEEITNLFKI